MQCYLSEVERFKSDRLVCRTDPDVISRSRLSILLGPLSGSLDSGVLVLFPSLSDVVGERVIGVGCTEESLNRKQDGTDLQGR